MLKFVYALAYYARLLCHIVKRFEQDGCSYRAASLTLTTLLSLAPLMAIGISIMTLFPDFQELEGTIQQFIFTNFVPTSGEIVLQQLQLFAAQITPFSWLGSSFLFATAISMMMTIEYAFNAIWRVRGQRRRLGRFLVYWTVLLLAPILIGLSFVLSDYLLATPIVTAFTNKIGLSNLRISSISFVIAAITFSFLYIVIPNAQVKIRHGLIGGAITAILFEWGKKGFIFYINSTSTYTLIYGTLATIPLFLLWLYLSWAIILFGAEITSALAYRHNFLSGIKHPAFLQAFRWIGYLWHAKEQGKSLSLSELAKCDPDDYDVELAELLRSLQTAGFVEQLKNGDYILACDIASLTLFDLYERLPWRFPNAQELNREDLPQEQAFFESLFSFKQAAKSALNIPLTKMYDQS